MGHWCVDCTPLVSHPSGPPINFTADEALWRPPAGAQEMGIAVVGASLPELVWTKLRPWHGRPIGGKERSLKSWQWQLIKTRGSTLINWHPAGAASATGGMPANEQEELAAATEGLDAHWKRLDKSVSPRSPSKGSRRGSSSGASQRRPSPRGDPQVNLATEDSPAAPDSDL